MTSKPLSPERIEALSKTVARYDDDDYPLTAVECRELLDDREALRKALGDFALPALEAVLEINKGTYDQMSSDHPGKDHCLRLTMQLAAAIVKSRAALTKG